LHGKSYTKGWAKAQRNLLAARIIPEFGSLDIREVYAKRVDAWLLRLKEEGTGYKTLNHLITILRIVFGYAAKAHDIEENPMGHIERFSGKSPEKGILSRDDLARLFSGDGAVWPSRMHYALNLTAAATGMRLGELLALKFEKVEPYFITIAYSWSDTDGLKCPKNGRERKVPISESLYMLLHSLGDGRQPSDFIFSSRGDKPIGHKTVYKNYYHGLGKIGITRDLMREKRLTFHSYRHLFNTLLLECGVAPETVRLFTGHSARMTAHYSHVQLTSIQNPPLASLAIPQPTPEKAVQSPEM
jgi:integrase